MLPVIALIVMGMVDFGRAFYTYEALINAAREGARYCALNPGNLANTVVRIQGELDNRIVGLHTNRTTCANPGVGQPITVSVAARFTPITPLIDQLLRRPLHPTNEYCPGRQETQLCIAASATMAATR